MNDKDPKATNGRVEGWYNFRGVKLRQKVLSYTDFGRVLKIMKDGFHSIEPDRAKFTATIDEWYESGKLRELFKIVLVPDEPSLWAKLLNRFMAWHRKFDLTDPIVNLDLPEIAEVNADFFLLNSKWIGNLMLSQRSWELSEMLTQTVQTRSAVKSSSPGSAKETQTVPSGSAN